MRRFWLTGAPGERVKVLCLGAHSDDIEIGVGGTILTWLAAGLDLDVTWCVLSGGGSRRAEAEASATAFLTGAVSLVEVADFSDSLFPAQFQAIKNWFEDLRGRVDPDVIFTHTADDSHQDHRLVQKITWNTFRDHQIFEYEIPKWEGDLGRMNAYVPLSAEVVDRKVEYLKRYFESQRRKDWFDEATFRSLAHLRGNECRAPDRLAEAFRVRKMIIA